MTNNSTEKTVREPLFHIVKKSALPLKKAIGIRLIAIVAALVVSGIFCALFLKTNPFLIFSTLIDGAVGSSRRIWGVLQDTALLLGVSLALLPAFKMKFWNLGGNGQILMGSLAATACMFYLGGKWPDGAVIVLMVVSSIAAGAIWAVIPAIFKAFFKTNESLFTLMMNYTAAGLVAFFINVWVKSGSGTLNPIEYANLPEIGNKYLLTIIVIALLTVGMYVYMKYSKHGYELSVVGESENTARYVGINVKKVIIRTLVLSGAICGIVGLLLAGAINHNITESSANNMGFTAILATWLAKFNPIIMVLTSFFITFLEKGMRLVRTTYGLTNNALSDIIIGIIYFFVIGCEFFITYKLIFRKGKGSSDEKKCKETVPAEAVSVEDNANTVEQKEDKQCL